MKINKKALATILAVTSCGFAGAASAHTYAGAINAGGANRHDLLQTTCFSWGNGVHPTNTVGTPGAGEVDGAALRFVASLTGTGPGLTIQALPKGTAVTGNAVSFATQNATAGVFTSPNNGVYFVKVNRAAASNTSTVYTATLHCTNGTTLTSPHTGTGEGFAGDVGTVVPSVDYNVLINQ